MNPKLIKLIVCCVLDFLFVVGSLHGLATKEPKLGYAFASAVTISILILLLIQLFSPQPF